MTLKSGPFRREYRTWLHMRHRCYWVTGRDYASYGGRGIRVCDRWRDSLDAFIADMGPRPSSKHSIDRIDNDGDYAPENCRWATTDEQANNKRTSRKVTHDGQTLTVAQWSALCGVARNTLKKRLDNHWPISRALQPARSNRWHPVKRTVELQERRA